MSTEDKGRKYEKEVALILEKKGWRVERAPKQVVWILEKKTKRRIPISRAHDFFNCWDGVAKREGHKTIWFQVSTWEHKADKIRQVSLFPYSPQYDECLIFCRIRGGRNPHFRVLSALNNYEWTGWTEMVVKK